MRVVILTALAFVSLSAGISAGYLLSAVPRNENQLSLGYTPTNITNSDITLRGIVTGFDANGPTFVVNTGSPFSSGDRISLRIGFNDETAVVEPGPVEGTQGSLHLISPNIVGAHVRLEIENRAGALHADTVGIVQSRS